MRMIGFVILRRVYSNESNNYWKECYKCIRRHYDNPILIIDNNSKTEFLKENMDLVNCDVVYDTQNKESEIALAYYYFHKLRPFDQAIIFHDTVFIQMKIDFELGNDENIRFIWSYDKKEFFSTIDVNFHHLCHNISGYFNIMRILHDSALEYEGCFEGMCIIKWKMLDTLEKDHKLFSTVLPRISRKSDVAAFEKLISLFAYYKNGDIPKSYFGNIHKYINTMVSYTEYLTGYYSDYPIVKVCV